MKEKKIIWEKDGSEMALIPAGSFEMGDHSMKGMIANYRYMKLSWMRFIWM